MKYRYNVVVFFMCAPALTGQILQAADYHFHPIQIDNPATIKKHFDNLTPKAHDSFRQPHILTKDSQPSDIRYDQAVTSAGPNVLYLVSSKNYLPDYYTYVFILRPNNEQTKRIKIFKQEREARKWILEELFPQDISCACS